MPELTDEELQLWQDHQGKKPVPGSAEPIEGRCAAKLNLQNKGLRDLNIQTLRYCKQTKGAGTDHEGFGNCKWHLGATTKQELAAIKTQVLTLAEKRRDAYENPAAIGNWMDELNLLARQMKAWKEIIGDELLKRSNLFTTTTTGKEEEIALINTLREANRDFVDVIKWVSKMDLDNKKIQLQQEQAVALANFILEVALDSSIGLTDEQAALLKKSLRAKMHKITPVLKKEQFDFIDAEEVDDDEDS